MIARVIPIQRVPAHLHAFDYTVPEALADHLQVGHLVTISFRQSTILGLVLSFAKKSDNTLKEINQIHVEEPILSHEHLALIEMLHTRYGISGGTAAKMLLPPLQKRKLQRTTVVPFIHSSRPAPQKSSYVVYDSEQSRADHITNTIAGTTLILVPEVHHIDTVLSFLTDEQQKVAVTWHSTLSPKEKFDRWFQIRNGEKTIVVGTRGACMLAFPALDTIIMDCEHDEQHKHWDQAPRFHAKDIVSWLTTTYGAASHFLSSSPSCAAYYAVHKKKMNGSCSPQIRTDNVAIVDMAEERRAGRFALLADEVKDALRTSQGDMFLFIQRKGFSSSVGCNRCSFIAQCLACQLPLIFHDSTNSLHCHYCRTQQPMIRLCPTCHMDAVVLHGAGTEFLESGVRSFFDSDDTKNIVRIDSDLPFAPGSDPEQQRIIVGTEMAFPHIRWNKTDTIVCVDIDKQLAIPEYTASEHVWHLLAEMCYKKRADATLCIQTTNPRHLVLRGLFEPERFYRTELNTRRALHYPPYTYLVRYFVGADTHDGAQKEATRVHTDVNRALTEGKKTATLSLPVEMHPRWYRNKFWYMFLAKCDPTTATDDTELINTHIPSTWKIDPNPINILHP